ncbi:MAG TPA: NTPase [Dehalococcoidia bacterium]|jgi:nucleoside-triphosphatase|nr:NTPase [Dehalococcoidia bacterium]
MKPVYLLTGRPGTGKTSLIKQAVAELEVDAGGFYTEEIRDKGTRLGFKLVTLDGEEVVLAHVNIHSPYRVGKYGVDIEGLERVGVAALRRAAARSCLVIVDEIGKMELFSAAFRESVLAIANSGKRVLGTIMLAPNPWADAIKRLPQVKLVEVTRANREQVRDDLRDWLATIAS